MYPIGIAGNPLIIKLISLHPSFDPHEDELSESKHYEILNYTSGISLKKFNHDSNNQITAFIPLLKVMFPTFFENVFLNEKLLSQLSKLEREELQVIVDVLMYDSIEVLPDDLDEEESIILERKLALLFLLDKADENELTYWKKILFEGVNLGYLESFGFTEKAKQKVAYYIENFECGVYLNNLHNLLVSNNSITELDITEKEDISNPLWELFTKECDSDIDISITSEDGLTSFTVKCHKTILMSKSLFFEAFLSNQNCTWNSSEIFPYETLFIIEYIYGKENLEIPNRNLLNLMKKDELNDLIEYCTEIVELTNEEEANKWAEE